MSPSQPANPSTGHPHLWQILLLDLLILVLAGWLLFQFLAKVPGSLVLNSQQFTSATAGHSISGTSSARVAGDHIQSASMRWLLFRDWVNSFLN